MVLRANSSFAGVDGESGCEAAAAACPRACRDPAPAPDRRRQTAGQRASELKWASSLPRCPSRRGRLLPIRDGLGAAPIRCRELFRLSSRKQAVVFRVEGQKPLLGRGMRLDRAVMQDVADGKPALGELRRDEETAVTIERLAFGAHQADARACRGVQHLVEAAEKFRLPGPLLRNRRRPRGRGCRPAAGRRDCLPARGRKCPPPQGAPTSCFSKTTENAATAAPSARRRLRLPRRLAASRQNAPPECWNGRC